MRPPVTYPASLADLVLFADAAAELDGYKHYLPVKDFTRIAGMVDQLHSTVERLAGQDVALIYDEGEDDQRGKADADAGVLGQPGADAASTPPIQAAEHA
jgi:hypothetical protein